MYVRMYVMCAYGCEMYPCVYVCMRCIGVCMYVMNLRMVCMYVCVHVMYVCQECMRLRCVCMYVFYVSMYACW